MTAEFSQYGLTTEAQLHVARLVEAYDPNLSLRRLPERDPAAIAGAKRPTPHTFGIFERNVAPGQPNWVFTMPESAVTPFRVMSRIRENDLHRGGVSAHAAKFQAQLEAKAATDRAADQARAEERREEQLGIAELAQRKTSFKHRMPNGDLVVIGDRVRTVRRHV